MKSEVGSPTTSGAVGGDTDIIEYYKLDNDEEEQEEEVRSFYIILYLLYFCISLCNILFNKIHKKNIIIFHILYYDVIFLEQVPYAFKLPRMRQ